MRYFRKSLTFLLVLTLVATLAAPIAVASASSASNAFGRQAYGYVEELSAVPRFVLVGGGEADAAEMVKGWMRELGYRPRYQTFSFVHQGTRYASQNVVAVKRASGRCGDGPVPLVIVGAHYDAVPRGQGADDNASGVGTMLEIAGRLAGEELPYDLAFIAFGAEEVGLIGSTYYVSQMSKADLDRAVVMINFDSLIAGDFRYVHAGWNRETWARDAMLEIVERPDMDLDIITQPGLARYPAGLTPNGFSDYTAFSKNRIPIVAFESTNWSVGNFDGYQQTEAEPYEFWHTPDDTLEIIESYYPGRPLAHLNAYTRLVYTFLSELEP